MLRTSFGVRGKVGGKLGNLTRYRKLMAPIVVVAIIALALCFTATLVPGKAGTKPEPAPEPVAESVAAVADKYEDPYVLGSLVPTYKWVNFYGMESVFGKQPLPVGAVITARDPQNVVCGEFLVTVEGLYGLMPVYGDDPMTGVDEGAIPGDPITFYINGIMARVAGPDEPVWTEFGDLKQVDLEVSQGMVNRVNNKPN